MCVYIYTRINVYRVCVVCTYYIRMYFITRRIAYLYMLSHAIVCVPTHRVSMHHLAWFSFARTHTQVVIVNPYARMIYLRSATYIMRARQRAGLSRRLLSRTHTSCGDHCDEDSTCIIIPT